MTSARSSRKQASRFEKINRQRAFGWPQVVRVLPDGKARSLALNRFRTAGFTPDDFVRSKTARKALCDALTATEDFLELERKSKRIQEQIRKLMEFRRELEVSLWP